MKTIITILFLCSVALSQQAAVTQSSEVTGSTLQQSFSTETSAASVITFAAPTAVAIKGVDGHWHLEEGKTLDDVIAAVVRAQSDSEGWNSTLSDQTERLLSELDRERSETRRQREVAEGWRQRYIMALQLGQEIIECTQSILHGLTDASPECRKKDSLVAIMQEPLPGEAIKKKRKAGAHSEATRKPDSEKPERNCRQGK